MTEMQSVASITGEELEKSRGKSFAEALASVPGVSKLSSGTGMAKPVVRGQFGRRLLLLVDSVQHRSQEWGLDHAPEVDPFIADELRVVRGASGVRYGPGAIGGAVIAEPPKFRVETGYSGQLHLLGFLARGGGFASRLQMVPAWQPDLCFQLEASIKALASATTPLYPFQNTGSVDSNLGASLEYRKGDDIYSLSYRHYAGKLGVCACLQIESSEDFYAQIDRAKPIHAELFDVSLAIDRPYQQVAHDLAMARGKWPLFNMGTLVGTYALQFDNRKGGPSHVL